MAKPHWQILIGKTRWQILTGRAYPANPYWISPIGESSLANPQWRILIGDSSWQANQNEDLKPSFIFCPSLEPFPLRHYFCHIGPLGISRLRRVQNLREL